MKRLSRITLVLTLVLFGYSAAFAANMMGANGSVAIISPRPNQVCTGNKVAVNWRADMGKDGNHVHLYLDGKLLGPKYGSSYTLSNLSPGKHTVELRLATKNHQELGPRSKVSFMVKPH